MTYWRCKQRNSGLVAQDVAHWHESGEPEDEQIGHEASGQRGEVPEQRAGQLSQQLVPSAVTVVALMRSTDARAEPVRAACCQMHGERVGQQAEQHRVHEFGSREVATPQERLHAAA